MAGPDAGARRAELELSLREVQARLAAAGRAVGRDPGEVTLIAVTKRFPVDDARMLFDLGVHDLGESRDQEARAKAAALPEPRWHFVGQLQTNKAKSVVRYASAVHSVDRPELAQALDSAAGRIGRDPLDVFVQISLDDDPTRGGVSTANAPLLADTVAASENLRLVGVMTVAPMGLDPGQAFARLRDLSASLRAAHPQATSISAGMSTDLEAAIANGATHVRVGTALLGPRATDVG
jgi:pyridoxal phosphate enzyme (YggS family)